VAMEATDMDTHIPLQDSQEQNFLASIYSSPFMDEGDVTQGNPSGNDITLADSQEEISWHLYMMTW
jgi:hypothetical protein